MKRSGEVRAAMLRFYERFSAGDTAAFDALVSRERESMSIGTAPHEWHDEREQWRHKFAPPGVRLEAGPIKAWEEGSVGWLADRPSFVLPDGLRIPTRVTAVLHREDGSWKIVNLHVSAGMPDEMLFEMLRGG